MHAIWVTKKARIISAAFSLIRTTLIFDFVSEMITRSNLDFCVKQQMANRNAVFARDQMNRLIDEVIESDGGLRAT